VARSRPKPAVKIGAQVIAKECVAPTLPTAWVPKLKKSNVGTCQAANQRQCFHGRTLAEEEYGRRGNQPASQSSPLAICQRAQDRSMGEWNERSVPMRWTCWVFALLAVPGLMTPAVGFDAYHGTAGLSGGRGSCEACSRPMCANPGGFAFVPGCCECQPSCCDNAWAGYCQQKARWQAFWARVGMPRPSHWHAVSCWGPAPSCPGCNNALPAQSAAPTTGDEPANRALQPLPEPPAAVPGRPPDPARLSSPQAAPPTAPRPPQGDTSGRWRSPGFR